MRTEIRIHGRGGQGAKSAGQLVAEAALERGKNIQAYPEFGPERGGAPVRTFVRISDDRIKTHEPVVHPDIVMVIDDTLLSKGTVEGLKEGGVLLVNTRKNKEELKEKTGFSGKIFVLDASKISLENLGMNKPNVPMIGALVKITGIVPLEILEKKIEGMFLRKIGKEKTEANIRSLRVGHDEVKEAV